MADLPSPYRRQILAGGCALAMTSILASPGEAATDLDAIVAEQMATSSIPGLAVGITHRGRVTTLRTYGFADIASQRRVTSSSMFHIASVTKTVTALAIMRLIDQGLIALDEPIAPHLDFTILGAGASGITFRQLLMHTSGISDARYYEIDFRERGRDSRLPLEDMLKAYLVRGGEYADQGNLKSLPGTTWDYSNIGYGLLGYLGSRIAGLDLRAAVNAEIFRPMGLRHTAWSIADTPADLSVVPYDVVDGRVVPVEPVSFPDWSAGMLRASIGDLTRLVAIASNCGVVEGRRIISAATARQMLEMERPSGLPDWLTGQGLGWQQSKLAATPTANHWGGDPGVFTMAYVDPSRLTGIAILSNLSATPGGRDALKAIAAAAMSFVA